MTVPQKSPADDRSYKVLSLPNKLTVLLVSDPTTDKVSDSADLRRRSSLSRLKLVAETRGDAAKQTS